MSVQLVDEVDNDLSGALIWAVEAGSGPNGDGVEFFAAWGQNPLLTGGVFGNDAGYSLLGDIKLRPSKDWELKSGEGGTVYVGDHLLYTHTIVNTGYSQFGRGRLSICDQMPDELEYVEGTAMWELYLANGTLWESGMVNTSDTNFGDIFGENCFSLPEIFPPRGGRLVITYEAIAFRETAPVGDVDECYDAINRAEIRYMSNRKPRNLEYYSETPICYKCINDQDVGVDSGCNETYPNCDADTGYYGDECLPPPTTSTRYAW